MRLRFTAEMIGDNGERVSMPIEIETAVPNPEEFGDKSRFYEILHQFPSFLERPPTKSLKIQSDTDKFATF